MTLSGDSFAGDSLRSGVPVPVFMEGSVRRRASDCTLTVWGRHTNGCDGQGVHILSAVSRI